MKRPDFRQAKPGRSLFAALLMCVASAGAVLWTRGMADTRLAEEAAARAELGRLRAAAEYPAPAEDLPGLLLTYRTLAARGIGRSHPETPLEEWEGTLEAIAGELRLEGLHHEFSATASPPAAAKAGFTAHHLNLRVELAHEEELLRLLEEIQARASALVLLRGCRLTRLAESSPFGKPLAHLVAECRSDWLTLTAAAR